MSRSGSRLSLAGGDAVDLEQKGIKKFLFQLFQMSLSKFVFNFKVSTFPSIKVENLKMYCNILYGYTKC